MTNDTLPSVVCAACGSQNLPGSRFCSTCGRSTSGGAFAAPASQRPRSLTAIAICGVITAVPALIWNLPWPPPAAPHSAYQIFNYVFDLLGLPLNILLLAACLGFCGRGKAWGRRWMLWWAGLITIYESLQLVIAVFFIAPHATAIDLGMTDVGDVSSLLGADYVKSTISLEYSVYWISMVSLAVWAWWVLRQPAAQAYFEPQNDSAAPPVS